MKSTTGIWCCGLHVCTQMKLFKCHFMVEIPPNKDKRWRVVGAFHFQKKTLSMPCFQDIPSASSEVWMGGLAVQTPNFSLLCFLPKSKVTLSKHGDSSPVPPHRKSRNRVLISPLHENWRFENPTAHIQNFNWFSNFSSSCHYHLKLLGLQVKSSCWYFRVTGVSFVLSELPPPPSLLSFS